MLHYLTSSFAPVIIATATRGHHLTLNAIMGLKLHPWMIYRDFFLVRTTLFTLCQCIVLCSNSHGSTISITMGDLVIIAPLNSVDIVINWCILPNKSVLIVKCVRYYIFKLDPL